MLLKSVTKTNHRLIYTNGLSVMLGHPVIQCAKHGDDMSRPGNHVCLWILATFGLAAWLQPPFWVAFIFAFAIGWLYNEDERKKLDSEPLE